MDRDPTIIKSRRDYLNPALILYFLSAISSFPVLAFHPQSISLFDFFLLLFNAFFFYPYVLIHEFGHILFFFFFYPYTQTIILRRDSPAGYIVAMDYIVDFPTSFIALGGPFVNLFFIVFFGIYLYHKGFYTHVCGVINVYRDKNRIDFPSFSFGEKYGLYAFLFNLNSFLNSIIPFKQNLAGHMNDAYQFLRGNGIEWLDFSISGVIPSVTSAILGLSIFFVWYFVYSCSYKFIQRIRN